MLVLAVISVCAITALVQIAALQQNVSKKTQTTDITSDTNSEVITGVMQILSQLFFEVQQLRAELQCSLLISSCSSLPPSCPSDYYRLRVSNGSAVRVYCDMTLSCGGVTGGWMRVAELNTTNSRQQCPDGLMERADGRCAGLTVDGCSSVFYSTQKINYTNVCGRITAYQVGTTNAFGRKSDPTIDSNYMDGVSLTHGSSTRQHIWTFAAALDRTVTYNSPGSYCPCQNSTLASIAPSLWKRTTSVMLAMKSS